MVEERDMARGIIIGGIGGTVLGGTVAAALLAREVKAAELPPDKKFDYLLETQTTIVQLLAKLVETSQTLIERNQAVIELLRQLLAAQGIVVEIPEIPGVPPEERIVTVVAPWKAAEPEEIFKQGIRAAGTFYADRMVDWRQGKRLYFFVQSTLNQDVSIQVISSIADTHERATDINTAKACAAGDTISIGLAWDHWSPYVGIRITVSVAPTTGMLNIYAIKQE